VIIVLARDTLMSGQPDTPTLIACPALLARNAQSDYQRRSPCQRLCTTSAEEKIEGYLPPRGSQEMRSWDQM
jgi:hypothetical protein